MSSRPDVYRILIAGDEELGFSLCAKALDRNLNDPRTVARESLEETWPEDEWTKLVTISKDGIITTYELDLELHGPWVWELYSTLEPRDYFRRFSGVILCANPFRETLPSELSNFMNSVKLHVGHPLPTIMIVDRSTKLLKGQTNALRGIAETLAVSIIFIRLNTGENIEKAFKSLTEQICGCA
ncbi:MAG: hypothetical protein AM325_004765 [Candidatus Thorarchaeota archaeon SMTZ1-45]|nr:MAG: hypothetical protein AM325_06525 [Candidatus Thorarchaeota archaeon SMTZ1-45]